MMRRSLLAFSTGLAGIIAAGCLGGPGSDDNPENSEEATETDNSEEATGSKETEERGTETENTATDFETSFEVRDVDYIGTPTQRASVTFDNHIVNVTGAVSGSNSCYTARLGGMMIKDQTLVVQVESFEDAAEDEGCRDAIVEIEYHMSVKITGELPASVRVEHNGKHVTTEQSP